MTGLLPSEVPTTPIELTSSKFASLRIIGELAPKLGSMSAQELEKIVATLPDDANPKVMSAPGCEAVIRGYANLAAHLIHRPHFSHLQSLPATVARPLWYFSKHVKRPPTLTYASYTLANFTSPVRQRTLPTELHIAQTPSGTVDEEWFVAVHLSAESASGEVVEALSAIDRAIKEHDHTTLIYAIETIESCAAFATEVMPMVREYLRPDVFLNKIRPYLYGYDNICFHGVHGNPLVSYIGETGAQSGMIRAIDSALGVHHSESISASMDRFLLCAPQTHQDFFKYALELGQQLDQVKYPAVQNARRSALQALSEFRSTHYEIVKYYLSYTEKIKVETGTGGTRFGIWLQQMIDETDATMHKIGKLY